MLIPRTHHITKHLPVFTVSEQKMGQNPAENLPERFSGTELFPFGRLLFTEQAHTMEIDGDIGAQ